MPDVTLTIKVKDGEVVTATGKLNNLEKAANNVGKVDVSSELKKQGGVWQAYVDGVTQGLKSIGIEATASEATVIASVGAIAAALAAVIAVVLAVVAVIGTVTVVAYKAAEAAFNLAENFAAAGSEIGKLQQETGLAAETISALRHEADRTNTSFGNVEAAANSLRKTIGQAAGGSEIARKNLTLLGIDGAAAINNIDTAFKTAIATIVKLPPGIEQSRAAYAAFGEDGYKLIPFFQSFNGNVDEAIKRATELGQVFSGKDVQASQEFTKALSDTKSAAEGIKLEFGRELLPVVAKVLTDFTSWVKENRSTVREWATIVANSAAGIVSALGSIVKFIDDHPILIRVIAGAVTAGATELALYVNKGKGNVSVRQQTYDYTRPQDAQPDLAALEAQRAEMEKKMAEATDRAKRDWDAAIESWNLYGEQAGKVLSDTFNKLKDQFDKLGDAAQFKAGAKGAIDEYLANINAAYTNLETLEDEKDRRNKATENEVKLRGEQQLARRRDYGQKATDIERRTNDVIAAGQKKLDAEALGELEARIRREIELYDERDQTELQRRQRALATGQTTEQQYLDFIKKNEVDALEFRKTKLQELLQATSGNARKRADIEGQISVIDEQITRKKAENEERLTAVYAAQRDIRREINRLAREDADPTAVAARQTVAALNEQLSLTQQIHDLRDAIANQGLNDALIIEAAHLQDILDYRNRELQAVLTINRAQLELDHSMEISQAQIKAQVLDHLAQQRTLNQAIADGINQTYDDIASKLDDQIDKMFAWAGAFKSLFTEPLKAISRSNLTKLTRGLLDAVIPGLGTDLTKTNNPIARPIVDEIEKTNALLSQLVRATGQVPAAGGGIGGLLGGLLGIGGGSGSGPGTIFGGSAGGGIYNLGGGGGGGLVLNTGNLPGAPGSPSNASGGFLDRLRNVFSSQPGGIFAPPTNPITGHAQSPLSGYLSGAGTIAQLAGGLIGGYGGQILSAAGTGLSIGAMFGPIGAAIGAGIGALIGIFSGDPKKKKDKNENLPKLQQGFTDAFTELNSILADIRALRIDPDEAVSRATAVRNQIATGFGIQFGSKKYRKESQQLIATRLAEADRIINEIKSDAAIARGAADRTKRILPEFAGGTYFADFFRPNGLVPGMFDGRDDIMAMISRGEMVLNPAQQNRVRSIAGGDVFAHAGIPNYPRASTSPRLATGGIAGQGLALAAQPTNITVQPRFTLVLQGDVFDERASAYLQGDDGRRVQAKVTKQLKLSGDI